MAEKYSADVYHRFLLNGDARGAAAYLRQFPEHAALAERYDALFEQPFTPATDNDMVNAVLSAYAAYYREACWVQMKHAAALINLHDRLRDIFSVSEPMELQTLEDTLITPAFEEAGFRFRGIMTGGRRGAYVWRDTEVCTYEAALPEGTRTFTVKLLSGFIHKSWLDHISLGMLGSSAWIDADGCICCICDGCDTESEHFRISVLEHEAQHAADKARFPRIKPHELEYRAKLAELIDSKQRNMPERFLQEADPAVEASDDAYAAEMIVAGLCRELQCTRETLPSTDAGSVKDAARRLLLASSAEMADKYNH